MIEGCPPVHIAFTIDGETLLFERAMEPQAPFWFIKEAGKQVYRYTGKR